MKLAKRAAATAVLSLAVAATAAAEVVVTIKPLHSLVQGVMGETGTARLLIKESASPHGQRLTPSYLRVLTEAKVVFLIDENFESFLKKLPPDSLASAVVASELAGITLHERRDRGVWAEGEHDHAAEHEEHDHAAEHEEHDHAAEHEEHDHAAEHEEHDHAAEHEEHDHAAMHEGHDHSDENDLHLWLDTHNAKVIVAAAADTLSRMMPENRAVYQANAENMTMRLDALTARLSEKLAGVQSASFFTYHDATQYFEKQYGLQGAGGLVWSPGENLSAARMLALREKITGGEVACILREPQFSSRPIETLIEGGDARSGTVDVLGAELPAGEELYFTLMENLAQTLVTCLAGE